MQKKDILKVLKALSEDDISMDADNNLVVIHRDNMVITGALNLDVTTHASTNGKNQFNVDMGGFICDGEHKDS